MKAIFRSKKNDTTHSCTNSSQKSVNTTPTKGKMTSHGFTASSNPGIGKAVSQTVTIVEVDRRTYDQMNRDHISKTRELLKNKENCEKEAAVARREAAAARREAAAASREAATAGRNADRLERESAEAGRSATQFGAEKEAAQVRKAAAEKSIQERYQRIAKMQEETKATHAKIDEELADLLKDLDLDQADNPIKA